MPARSTKETDRKKALAVAMKMYGAGVETTGGKKQDIQKLTLRDNIRKADLSDDDLLFLLEEYKRRGLLKNYILTGSKKDLPAFDFLLNFWTWEKSDYIREKIRQNHRMGKRHVSKMYGAIKNHWQEIVKDKDLCEITKQDIKKLIEHLSALTISYKSKNDIIRAGTTAIRWAFNNELLDKDPTQGIIFFSGTTAPREILTPEIVQALFSVDWNDPRAKLANMLAMCTGLRAGEIQALQLKSLGENCLYIKHSWNFQDGLKCPKNGETRTVYLPFPFIIDALKSLGECNPYGQGLDGFIFWGAIPTKPMENKRWLEELHRALQSIGMEAGTAKKYCFHAWRHYFTAYMKNTVDDRILQRQTGHKTHEMLEHYASHTLSGDQIRLQQAQVQAFGNLLPQSTGFSFDASAQYKYVQIGGMDKSGMYAHSRQDR